MREVRAFLSVVVVSGGWVRGLGLKWSLRFRAWIVIGFGFIILCLCLCSLVCL